MPRSVLRVTRGVLDQLRFLLPAGVRTHGPAKLVRDHHFADTVCYDVTIQGKEVPKAERVVGLVSVVTADGDVRLHLQIKPLESHLIPALGFNQ